MRVPCDYHSLEKINNMFRTCMIMHNRILDYYNWSAIGQKEEDWIDADVELDDERIKYYSTAGCSKQTKPPKASIVYNLSDEDVLERDRELGNNHEDYIGLSHEFKSFRELLVNSYRYMFEKKLIKWLKPAREAMPRIGIEVSY